MEENKVLATVNGVEITEQILDRTIAEIPAERRAYFSSEFGRKQLLDQMINVELINALGLEMKIQEDAFYRMRMEQLEKDTRFNATMNRIMSDLTVSDEEIQAKYEEQPEKYQSAESIGAKHILVDSQELAEAIKARLDAGELSFTEAAAQYSSCPSKEQGGDLGSFGRGMMVKEFEEAAFMSPLHAISEPVRTEFGYHIIQVYDKAEHAVQPLSEVSDSIRDSLLQSKQQERYTQVIADLRKLHQIS